MQLEIHVKSDVGRVRRGNEDNFLLLNLDSARFEVGGRAIVSADFPAIALGEHGIVLAVSDGMGGALAGEVASQMAVETVRDILLEEDTEITLQPDPGQTLIQRLYLSTLQANRLIHRKGRTEPEFNGMGATFTGAAILGEYVYFVQVGDSRAYLVRGGKIEQVTKDQSLVQQLIDSNQIQPEEAERHALRNVILQALGAQSEIYPVGGRFKPNRDDVLLICSDGLSNKLSAADLHDYVKKFGSNLTQACSELVREANARGGEDNITVVLARFVGDDLPVSTTDEIAIEPLPFDNF
jgi:PPM family protein phosphatase